MRLSALLLVVGTAACSPAPRATAYFEAHSQEAARIVKACEAGTHRGAECENAEAALVALRRDARMERYKKAFE